MKKTRSFSILAVITIMAFALAGLTQTNPFRAFAAGNPECNPDVSGNLVVTLNVPNTVPAGQSFVVGWNISWPTTFEPDGGGVDWSIALDNGGGPIFQQSSSEGDGRPDSGSYTVAGGISSATTYNLNVNLSTVITQCSWSDTENGTASIQSVCAINSFTCDSSTDTLSWSTSNCSSASISPTLGSVSLNGSASNVAPGFYTLTSDGGIQTSAYCGKASLQAQWQGGGSSQTVNTSPGSQVNSSFNFSNGGDSGTVIHMSNPTCKVTSWPAGINPAQINVNCDNSDLVK